MSTAQDKPSKKILKKFKFVNDLLEKLYKEHFRNLHNEDDNHRAILQTEQNSESGALSNKIQIENVKRENKHRKKSKTMYCGI